MRPIWFNPDCVRWIREGKKTTTFERQRKEGIYEVVGGSQHGSKPTGLRVRLVPIDLYLRDSVIKFHFSTEGDFKNADDFLGWLKKVGLLKKMPIMGWLHRIEKVNVGAE